MMRTSVLLAALLLNVSLCFAAEVPVRARIFLGASQPKLTEVNSELTTNNINKFSTFSQMGAELTYNISPLFDLGINYTRKTKTVESSLSSNTTSFAKIDQNVLLAIARINLVKTGWFRWDIFGAGGGSSSTMTYQTLSQSGEYSKKDTMGSLAARYGTSFAAGHKGIYLFLEGGYELNKVSSLKATGALDDTIKELDMSGPYGAVGVIFDAPELNKR